jgi:hypothetical protein
MEALLEQLNVLRNASGGSQPTLESALVPALGSVPMLSDDQLVVLEAHLRGLTSTARRSGKTALALRFLSLCP